MPHYFAQTELPNKKLFQRCADDSAGWVQDDFKKLQDKLIMLAMKNKENQINPNLPKLFKGV